MLRRSGRFTGYGAPLWISRALRLGALTHAVIFPYPDEAE